MPTTTSILVSDVTKWKTTQPIIVPKKRATKSAPIAGNWNTFGKIARRETRNVYHVKGIMAPWK